MSRGDGEIVSNNLRIKNATLWPNGNRTDLLVVDGRVSKEKSDLHDDILTIDAGGRIVLPTFSDLHIHLDSALTLGIPRFNNMGTLHEGIKIWKEYKTENLTSSDFRKRADKTIDWLVSLGITRIRTNIDVTDPKLTALKEAVKLREDRKNTVDLQITAFPQDGILTESDNAELLEKAMEIGADNVGIIPHNENTREDGIKSIKYAFDLAEKYGRNIDGHIDETDDGNSRFLEVLASEKIARNFSGTVAAGHATAMHSYDNAYASRLMGILKRADISIISNPVINLNLQGRFDTYPKRRGVTRIRQLLENGINVALGEDCIMDPWYPLGQGDILQSLQAAILAEQLTGEADLRTVLNLVTYNSAKAFDTEMRYGVREGCSGDLIIFDAKDSLEILRRSPARLYVIKNGNIIAKTSEPETEIIENGNKRKVEFRL